LASIWRACDDDNFGRIVRWLILLGRRRQEIGGIKWGVIDLAAGTWTLPSERSKNHRAHTIALPPAALTIIRAAPHTSDLLFGTRSASFSSWAHGRQALDQRLGGAVQPWRLHDIRRTVATRMADIGIEPHHIEACLNHYSGHRHGVAGIYNKSRYEQQIKSALLRWSEHVLALVEGRKSKVVALHV
jgi:integrase